MDSFTCKYCGKVNKDPLDETHRKILKFVERNPYSTGADVRREMVKKRYASVETVWNKLNDLEKKGELKKIKINRQMFQWIRNG